MCATCGNQLAEIAVLLEEQYILVISSLDATIVKKVCKQPFKNTAKCLRLQCMLHTKHMFCTIGIFKLIKNISRPRCKHTYMLTMKYPILSYLCYK